MVHSPRKGGGFISSPITLLFVGILTIYIFFQLFDVYSKKQYTQKLLHESEMYHKNVTKSLTDIEERNALIEDERGRDAYLREKEGRLLDGEELYVIVDTPKEGGEVKNTSTSWFKKIIPFLD